jgi:Zn-dependent peptidase ImmA (M78 family)/DNA-binding XRE family transcriptional regulator
MALPFNPKLLILARQARGLSQADIAERTQINQGFISKIENGLKEPPKDAVKRFSELLDFPESFFYQDEEIYGLPLSVHPFQHRKKRAVTIPGLNTIHAEINITIWNLKKLLQSVDLTFRNTMPYMDVDEYDEDIEKIAELTRRTWLLPHGPIKNLTECLEKAGCIVIWSDFHNAGVDGITLCLHNLPVCIFINKNRPADRMRFTLAHELGHIVMHKYPRPNMEDQADRFASAFLMPYCDIKESLVTFQNRVTLEHLAYLKPIWRVSIQAILMRAKDIGMINKTQSEYLWKKISVARIRFHEPPELDFPREEPALFPRILKLHIENLGYSVSDLSKSFCINEAEFNRKYGTNNNLSHSNNLTILS